MVFSSNLIPDRYLISARSFSELCGANSYIGPANKSRSFVLQLSLNPTTTLESSLLTVLDVLVLCALVLGALVLCVFDVLVLGVLVLGVLVLLSAELAVSLIILFMLSSNTVDLSDEVGSNARDTDINM